MYNTQNWIGDRLCTYCQIQKGSLQDCIQDKREADLEVTNKTTTVHNWKQNSQLGEDSKSHEDDLKKKRGVHENTSILVQE